jgi:hypothetical protein
MRSAVNQASNAANTAANTGAELGSEAQTIGSQITPFLTQEMLHPQGIGQTGIAAEQAAAEGGAGGATAGLTGQAVQRAAASRNAGGFQAALDNAARERTKAAAGASEGIQAGNEQAKLNQQQEGEQGLQKMYGTDTSGMLDATGQISHDVSAEAQANNSGWLQDSLGMVNAGANVIKALKSGGGGSQ